MVTFYRRLPKFEYLSPNTINEALSMLSQHRDKVCIMAGGTDLVPKLKSRETKLPEYILDLKNIPSLDYIRYNDSLDLNIGPLVTIRSVEKSKEIKDNYNILLQAAQSMASVQVRNRGTVAGNICSAVPSADMAPALLVLGAKMEIVSSNGRRIVNLEDFFTGSKTTAIKNDELLTEIQVPVVPPGSKGVYYKLSPRSAMDLAVVGVAVFGILEDEVCHDIRIGLGAVSPTPVRARQAEELLKGQRVSSELIDSVAEAAATGCCPISDHRASAEYRTEMVKVLVKRGIQQLGV